MKHKGTLEDTARPCSKSMHWRVTLLMAIAVAVLGCRGTGSSRSGQSAGEPASSGARASLDPATVDVCERVPGKAVAEALGGKLNDALSYRASEQQPSRCRYSITLGAGAGSANRTFIVWLLTPEQLEARSRRQDNPMTPVSGLGDVAFLTYAPVGERRDLYVLKRGVAAIEVTGEDRGALIKVAKVALAQL
jgi:hypothetical protein